MKYTQGVYPIISKKALAAEIYDMTISCPDVAQAAVCGQFVNIKADGFMLRRPISICGIDKEKGTLRIVFEVRGKGTKALSQLAEGQLRNRPRFRQCGVVRSGYRWVDRSDRRYALVSTFGAPAVRKDSRPT